MVFANGGDKLSATELHLYETGELSARAILGLRVASSFFWGTKKLKDGYFRLSALYFNCLLSSKSWVSSEWNTCLGITLIHSLFFNSKGTAKGQTPPRPFGNWMNFKPFHRYRSITLQVAIWYQSNYRKYLWHFGPLHPAGESACFSMCSPVFNNYWYQMATCRVMLPSMPHPVASLLEDCISASTMTPYTRLLTSLSEEATGKEKYKTGAEPERKRPRLANPEWAVLGVGANLCRNKYLVLFCFRMDMSVCLSVGPYLAHCPRERKISMGWRLLANHSIFVRMVSNARSMATEPEAIKCSAFAVRYHTGRKKKIEGSLPLKKAFTSSAFTCELKRHVAASISSSISRWPEPNLSCFEEWNIVKPWSERWLERGKRTRHKGSDSFLGKSPTPYHVLSGRGCKLEDEAGGVLGTNQKDYWQHSKWAEPNLVVSPPTILQNRSIKRGSIDEQQEGLTYRESKAQSSHEEVGLSGIWKCVKGSHFLSCHIWLVVSKRKRKLTFWLEW